MTFAHPLVLAGVGGAAGVVAAIVASQLRARRIRRRAARREQVKNLGRRYGLDMLGPHVPSDLVEAAARFRGDVHGVRLDEVMVGNDREGRFWVARRVVDGAEHHCFGFEIRGELNVRGLHLEPRAAGGAPRGWRRWLGSRGESTGRLRLHMRWEADAHRFEDELARQAVDRWTVQIAASCQPSGKTPVGLEVHGDRAWVHSLVPLEGLALGEFVRRGLEMRRQVLDEVRRRPATLKAPVARVSAEQEQQTKKAREETQPLFPVGRSEQADDDSGNNTVILSAMDLLRELPDPRSRSVRRRVNAEDEFEIPEPEEKVVVIRAR